MTACTKMYISYITTAVFIVNIIAALQFYFMMDLDAHFRWFLFPTLVGISFGYLIAKNRAISRALEIQATIDPLTQLNNRRFLNDTLALELARCNRYKETFCLILLDIDNFKKINDRYGHLIGDEILVNVSKILKENCRDSDVIARWGGEEFLVVMPNTSLSDAEDKAETLRAAIAAFQFSKVKKVTCSFGVAERNWVENENCDQVTNRADMALYKAKKQGKNCIKTSYYAVDHQSS